MGKQMSAESEVQITFDLNKLTAREIAPFLPAVRRGRMQGYIKLWTLTATSFNLGDPADPATYQNLPMAGPLKDILKVFHEAIKAAKDNPPNVKFDLTKATASEYDLLMGSIQRGEVKEIAECLAKFTVSCSVLEKVDDPEAWLDLPYYSQFVPAANALQGAGDDLYKRFLGA